MNLTVLFPRTIDRVLFILAVTTGIIFLVLNILLPLYAILDVMMGKLDAISSASIVGKKVRLTSFLSIAIVSSWGIACIIAALMMLVLEKTHRYNLIGLIALNLLAIYLSYDMKFFIWLMDTIN